MFEEQGQKTSYDKAIEAYKKVLETKNANPDLVSSTLTNIAFAYKAIGDIENAIKYFDIKFVKFPGLRDNNPELYYKLKKIYNELLKKRNN
jgi:tetratricopeptide (TPR) repeat protein